MAVKPMTDFAIPAAPSQATPASADGRLRRSQESRRQIVEALLALVGDGEIAPSAEQVAKRAKVGLRSVFRHFKDMNELYREITAILATRFAALAKKPFKAEAGPQRLREIVER